MSDADLGNVLGPYRIDREVGASGMGKVYAATGPDGVVALRVVHPHLLETPGFFERIQREAQIGASIRHPNVVRTLSCDEFDGTHVMAMEYVRGQTLSSLQQELEQVPEELWGRSLPLTCGASTSANPGKACNPPRCFRHWVVARADRAAATPLDEVIAMHTTIRRSIAAIAFTALLSTSAPLRAGEPDAAPTAADDDFAEAAARIERASALQHRPVEHGLVGMQARFRYTTTMFVNDEAGKAVVGQVVWTKETGLLVKFDKESTLNCAANAPLKTLDSLLKGPTDAFKITPRDRVTSCTDSVIEVVAHAPSELRTAGDSCGWVGAPTVRFTFDESGRVRSIRALGSPSAEARAAGAPDGMVTTMEWGDGPSDRSSVITRIRMDFLTGCEVEQQAAPTTLYWLDNRIEYAELGDARVPSHLVMDICRGDNEVLRRDELVFTEIAVHEAVPAAGLEGFRPNDERDAPPEPITVGRLAPEWSLMSSEGTSVSSKDSEGKAVVLMFWATWCGPCKRAAPAIQELIEEHGAENLAAYAITCSETRIFGEKTGHDAGEVLRSNGGRFPALVAGDDVASEYGVPAYPTIFVLDRTGKIVWQQTGYGDETRDELRAAVAAAVAAADASSVR